MQAKMSKKGCLMTRIISGNTGNRRPEGGNMTKKQEKETAN